MYVQPDFENPRTNIDSCIRNVRAAFVVLLERTKNVSGPIKFVWMNNRGSRSRFVRWTVDSRRKILKTDPPNKHRRTLEDSVENKKTFYWHWRAYRGRQCYFALGVLKLNFSNLNLAKRRQLTVICIFKSHSVPVNTKTILVGKEMPASVNT